MSRDNTQVRASLLVVCSMIAGCDGSRPGLLGDYAPAIISPSAPDVDAALPRDPQVDAGMPTAAAPVAMPTMAMPSVPDAGSASPPAATTTPQTTAPATSTPTQPLRDPDYVAVASESVGDLAVGVDEYICSYTDLVIPEDTWVTAIEVAPQHPDYTFRASVTVGPDQLCDGLGFVQPIYFDYFPASPRLELRAGEALFFAKGSRITVQHHYSGLAAKAPSTDTQLTEVRLWALPKGERPKYRVEREVRHLLNITLPVDAVDVTTTTRGELDPEIARKPGVELIGLTPVMNFLGQGMAFHVVAADGVETLALELTDWSLDARKEHFLEPGSYVPLSEGAGFKQSCTYSNRPEDQALDADGQPLSPQLTTFGELVRNEQCRMNVLFRYPI